MVLRADIGIRSGRRKLAFCVEYFRSDWRVIKSWNISGMAAQFIGCVSIWPLLIRESNLLGAQSVCAELAECSKTSQSNRQDEFRTEAVIEAVPIVDGGISRSLTLAACFEYLPKVVHVLPPPDETGQHGAPRYIGCHSPSVACPFSVHKNVVPCHRNREHYQSKPRALSFETKSVLQS